MPQRQLNFFWFVEALSIYLKRVTSWRARWNIYLSRMIYFGGEEYLFKLDDLFWQPSNQLLLAGNHLLLINISNWKFFCQIIIAYFGVFLHLQKSDFACIICLILSFLAVPLFLTFFGERVITFKNVSCQIKGLVQVLKKSHFNMI